ncbi:hypothetical protein AWM75_00700 [Aerococcus urinaehominis]|uniref:Uncharacterized protein n=1 Tax=Aerococcus urinaehominis TaxID=128944 RepID=A0A0X8FJQ7_9LACT|nr:type II toxin-antitoxin system RelE/ParE family toxin [Aerococcus urinaehominis]AMB98600.1 hypothetical protein AWM75_00700 [Aerococcus urinaehominis]SDL76210.1 Phage derived protein Gp49-like [Aerococcus urinaehominis]
MDKPTFDWGKDFDAFLNSLSNRDKAYLLEMIERIENLGLADSIQKQRVKKLDKNLYEIRVSATDSKKLRGIYFHLDNNTYFIVHGFIKKTAKTPLKEIRLAKERRQKEIDNHE